MYLIKEGKLDSDKCSCGKTKKFNRYSDGYHSTCGNLNCKKLHKTKNTQKTNIERYGVPCVLNNKDIQNRIKETNINRYGAECSLQNDRVKEKRKATMFKKYGTEHPLQNKDLLQKRNNSMIENHGSVSWLHSDGWKSSMIEKYGTTNCMEVKSIKNKAASTQKNNKLKTLIGNIEDKTNKKFIEESDDKGHSRVVLECSACNRVYSINRNGLSAYIRANKDSCPKCNYADRFRSSGERELHEWICEAYPDIRADTNRRFGNIEVDVFIESKNLAIEYNGLYWHNETHKHSKYHQEKSLALKKQGINLIHIWEDDWKLKNEIIKSIIGSKLGNSKTIGARKTKTDIISSKQAKTFHENNHLDSYANASYHIGLFYQNELISVASFGKARYKKYAEWELVRYSSKQGINVIGGFSRMLKRFAKETSAKNIVSYKKLDLGTTNFYESLGFSKIGTTGPNYFWIVDDIRMNRQNFMRSKLKDIKEGQTEVEYMNALGYFRIWDSGSDIFYKEF